MEVVLGIVAGALALGATVPYVRDTWRGRTRPHRLTWLIWCVLAVVALASQRADGASWSLLLVVGHLLATAVVLVLAVRRGVGGRGRIELLLFGVAGLGVVGWQLADEPTIATGAVIAADLIAVALMLPKTHRDPYSETLSAYVLSTVASVFALGAVGSLDPALLAYPIYLVVTGATLSGLIALRRRDLALAGRRAGGAA